MREYTVFNVDQCENLPGRGTELPKEEHPGQPAHAKSERDGPRHLQKPEAALMGLHPLSMRHHGPADYAVSNNRYAAPWSYRLFVVIAAMLKGRIGVLFTDTFPLNSWSLGAAISQRFFSNPLDSVHVGQFRHEMNVASIRRNLAIKEATSKLSAPDRTPRTRGSIPARG